MEVFKYRSDEDEGASNGGGFTNLLCVDRAIHVTQSGCWYDQTGCEYDAYSSESWDVTGPCDGSCTPKGCLTTEAVDLVTRFIESGGKEMCKWSKTTKLYPDAKQPETIDCHSRRSNRW